MQAKTHITDFLEFHARKSPNKAAIVTDDKRLNWQQLWQKVQAGAAFINEQLALKGKTSSQQAVAILLPNNWQHVVANLSVVHAGHMVLPIDVIFKPLEIDAVLRQLPPTLIITDDAGKNRISHTPAPIFKVKDFAAKPPLKTATYLRLPAKKQIASLLFTSGTTGKPKIVPYTHDMHIWNIATCSKVWGWTAQDIQLINLRLSHMYGLVMGLSGAVYHGGTMYLQDRFNEEKLLKLLSSGKVTMFSHGPQVYTKLLEVKNRKDYDLSGVRLFISGSGPLPPAVWQDFKDAFSAEILEVYGSTETGRIASNLLDERVPGSPGRPLPGVKVKFDRQGQVMVSSRGVFPGYINNPEATKKALNGEGFCKTGDIGELQNGRLILRGRLQERIRKQSYSVSPRDVEWALHEDRRIKEALVMGVQQPNEPDDKIVYFIVGDITEEQLREFCAQNLPSIWRPNQIIMLDSLPRTRSGKPKIGKLRKIAEVRI